MINSVDEFRRRSLTLTEILFTSDLSSGLEVLRISVRRAAKASARIFAWLLMSEMTVDARKKTHQLEYNEALALDHSSVLSYSS